ncbi:MAG: DUF378 domain-containing protein [Gammaproteobacteria bacterium]
MQRNTWDWIAFVLVIIGGINWGLLGLFNFNVIGGIFSFIPFLARLIYILIGIAAIYMIYAATKQNKPSVP